MFKSSAGKLFLVFSLVFASSCNTGRDEEVSAPNRATFAISETKSEIPFPTKEPEVYQTEIVIQIFAGNEKSERKLFAARNGARRLTIYDAGGKQQISRLETGAGQVFSIYRDKKIYAEFSIGSAAVNKSAGDFLTTEWLNQKTSAQFENLGVENGLSKFRVKLGGSENSEILMFVDENLRFPVRQELYSVNGEQKILTFSIEMKDFKSQADEKLFELPKDYQKVSPQEFQEILWQERTKNE